MRELRVVALSEDGQWLHLAGGADAARGGYRLRADDRLRAALLGELPPPGAPGVAPPPREIQARLRAGETAAQIAAAAGVPVARIERFAGPVLSEQEDVVRQARAARVVRRVGPSALPLGDAVDRALREAGADPGAAAWTARRDGTGRWQVEVVWTVRGRSRSAGWAWSPLSRALQPRDPQSAGLGHVVVPGEGPVAAPSPGTAGTAGAGRSATPEAAARTGRANRSRRPPEAAPNERAAAPPVARAASVPAPWSPPGPPRARRPPGTAGSRRTPAPAPATAAGTAPATAPGASPGLARPPAAAARRAPGRRPAASGHEVTVTRSAAAAGPTRPAAPPARPALPAADAPTAPAAATGPGRPLLRVVRGEPEAGLPRKPDATPWVEVPGAAVHALPGAGR